MKNIILFALLFSSLTIVYAQDYFMYVDGEKRYFEISSNKMLVQFVENTETNAVESVIGESMSFKVSNIAKTDHKEWHLISFFDTDKTKIMELIQNKNKNRILHSGVVFVDKNGEKIAALTNQIIVRLKQEDDYAILRKNVETYNIDSVWQSEFEKKTYLLSINHSSEKNAMQIANELYETGFFEYAEPNLMLFIKYGMNDTYFPDQWGLNNTGQYGGKAGMDIKVTQAWTVTTGNSNIKIAILDSGTDLKHPDLINNLLPGYDATGGNNNGDQSGIGHGTSCAGIAAASGNNSRGIVGVAYNCKILPIHMGYSPLASYVANGLNWARLNAANVVSMSFSTTETNDVNAAISNASSSNCVLVAATGNSNASTISYPARHPNIIAVGAASPCGTRKSPSSCDGETHWGSNYGNEISVVAPGVLISTTDILGDGGYNYNGKSNDYSNRDYTAWFNGTSAAAPHVAGVAALILSVNSNLRQRQVSFIIERTAQKTNLHSSSSNPTGYTYSTTPGRPNGLWHNEMGYGLVDAYEAVKMAQTLATCNSLVLNNSHNPSPNTTRQEVCKQITCNNITIPATAKLELIATDKVILNSGFKVMEGGKLTIYVP